MLVGNRGPHRTHRTYHTVYRTHHPARIIQASTPALLLLLLPLHLHLHLHFAALALPQHPCLALSFLVLNPVPRLYLLSHLASFLISATLTADSPMPYCTPALSALFC